jgi:hypothetical protein
MSDIIHKTKRNPKPVVDWPEDLTSASDINLFDEVMESLKEADNKNYPPSSK